MNNICVNVSILCKKTATWVFFFFFLRELDESFGDVKIEGVEKDKPQCLNLRYIFRKRLFSV